MVQSAAAGKRMQTSDQWEEEQINRSISPFSDITHRSCRGTLPSSLLER